MFMTFDGTEKKSNQHNRNKVDLKLESLFDS